MLKPWPTCPNMSFTLKYVFALVAVAAIFTAALIYRTPLWALAAVNLAIIVLLAGTFGVWFQRLNRTFWIPFISIGWVYLILSFTPATLNRLAYYLPSDQLSNVFT